MTKKENLKKLKEFWSKFWFIVWKDDSLKGWIISVIFIFVVIKFILFPILHLLTGTSLPLAIVESCSMHHKDNLFSDFDGWWQNNQDKYKKFNIDKKDFQDFPFIKGFTKGDILFITKPKIKDIGLGDIIIFNARTSGIAHPVIHRVISINQDLETGEKIFSTIGDNNSGQISSEKAITEEQIIGKAKIKLVPYAGWIKLIFFEPFQPSSKRGFC